MGEMADMILGWDEVILPFDRRSKFYTPPPKIQKTCWHCGEEHLTWVRMPSGAWRLGRDRKQHICEEKNDE